MAPRVTRIVRWVLVVVLVGAVCDVRTRPAARAEPPMSPVARTYLDTALDLLQQHAFRSASTDWPQLRAWAHGLASGAQVPADTYPAIQAAAKRLEKHSFLWSPAEYAATHAPPPDDLDVPAGSQVAGDLGLVTVPGFAMSDPAAQNRYVQAGLDAVRRLDAVGVCGWLVDLRGNKGGNYLPMVGAVAPVLGDGPLGSFLRADGSVYGRWSLDGGVFTRSDGSTSTFGTVPYRLRHPGPPVAVLTDHESASAAEATLISFLGRPDTRTFGEPTAGVPSGNTAYPLSDGAGLAITEVAEADRTGHLYEPDTPIAPDTLVPPGSSGTHAADPVVRQAGAWLHEQPACGAAAAAR